MAKNYVSSNNKALSTGGTQASTNTSIWLQKLESGEWTAKDTLKACLINLSVDVRSRNKARQIIEFLYKYFETGNFQFSGKDKDLHYFLYYADILIRKMKASTSEEVKAVRRYLKRLVSQFRTNSDMVFHPAEITEQLLGAWDFLKDLPAAYRLQAEMIVLSDGIDGGILVSDELKQIL